MSRDLRQLEASSRARPEDVAALRARLDTTLDPSAIQALLRTIPDHPQEGVARVRGALDRLPPKPRRPRYPARLLLGLIALFVVVAVPSTLVAAVAIVWPPYDDILVVTREAEIQAANDDFRFQRDVRGTTVVAGPTAVQVTCLGPVDHGTTILREGAHTCLPVSAEGLLARALDLEASGAPVKERLAALDLVTPLAEGAIADEVAVARASALVAGGQPAAALDAARARLPEASVRRQDLAEVAAKLALELEGCEGAIEALEILAPTHPDAARWLATCAEQPREPGR